MLHPCCSWEPTALYTTVASRRGSFQTKLLLLTAHVITRNFMLRALPTLIELRRRQLRENHVYVMKAYVGVEVKLPSF
jgi:hypothetical protein